MSPFLYNAKHVHAMSYERGERVQWHPNRQEDILENLR
jgi:hypothetical protein